MKYVALLRGINVGGKNKLPMKDLPALFLKAGCTEVETYIQSGNVVFEASASVAKEISSAVRDAIAEVFGFEVPIVVRSGAQLAAVVDANPFLRDAVSTKELHLYFLADKPNAAAVRSLDPDRSPPDEYVVAGQEIYVRAPNGLARTKLTNAYFDSKLKTVCTARSWATVLQLVAMTKS